MLLVKKNDNDNEEEEVDRKKNRYSYYKKNDYMYQIYYNHSVSATTITATTLYATAPLYDPRG